MINSLNKALFCSIALCAFSAYAQETPVQAPPANAAQAVVQGATPTLPHDTISITKGSDGAMQPAPPPAEPISSAAMPAPSIEVSNVSAPSIGDMGTLDDKNGGLPPDIWKGSTHESASALLTWMHLGVANPTLRDLTERLLLTRATAPTGSGSEWLLERAQALVSMGSDDKADQLITAVPASMMTDQLQQLHALLMLLHGDSDGACKAAQNAVVTASAAPTGQVPYWQKMTIFCKASTGHTDEATLALDLLRESNAGDDAFLQDIVHKYADKNFTVKNLPVQWSLFDVAVIRASGESDKFREKLDSLPPLALKYIATDATLDAKTREKAEGRAIQYGMLPIKELAKPPQPQPFARALAGDVTTLVTSLGTGSTAMEADNAVIARLALDDAAVQDSRRVQRLLSVMEPFGYTISTDTWNKLFLRRNRYDGDAPPATLIDKMMRAALAGNRGEVVLLAALTLNSADVDKTGELVIQPVVKSLAAAKFTKEARTIAHDAVQSYSTH